MTVLELAQALQLRFLTGEDLATQRTVQGCYCGDLLSWVMSRARADDAWLTVMGNVNAIGVAVLADLACIILTEDAAFDEDARKRALQNDVIVLCTGENTYQVAAQISRLL